MNNKTIYIISLILFSAAINIISSDKKKSVITSGSYFPVHDGTALIYKSSFGESLTRHSRDREFTISSSEADDFKYRQKLMIKDDGAYVKETYQYFKIFLFIKKEATITYSKPLLRFPLPLLPGATWAWEGDEYSDGDTNKVKITGKIFDKEFIITKAGTFESIKLESIVEGTSDSKNIITEWYTEGIGLIKAKIKIEGGGVMGVLRDVLGYGTIEFELTEMRKQ